MRRALPTLILVGCTASTGETTVPDRQTTDVLEIPDLTGIDFPAAFADALTLASTVAAGRPWDTHVGLLGERDPGCPDIYDGIPADDIDGLDPDMGGASWLDSCEAATGRTWAGWSWWTSDGHMAGELGNPIVTATGNRTLIADATVATDDGAVWELDGTITESLLDTAGLGGPTWVWTSQVDGTFGGSEALAGTDTPSGWRSDLYLHVETDVAAGNSFEARGNVYLFDARLHDRFDSLEMDLEILDALTAGPDGCVDEPLGWIGLRDADAVWYDLIFLPRDASDLMEPPYDNEPLSVCDGCGTLYVRGVESGQVCVDLSFALAGLVTPPDIESFVLPLRGLP